MQSTDGLFEYAHDLFQSAGPRGKEEKVPVFTARFLVRRGRDLRQTKEVLVLIAQARGRQQRVLFRSAEDLGETARAESKKQEEGSKKAKAVFGPSTSKRAPSFERRFAGIARLIPSPGTSATRRGQEPGDVATRETARGGGSLCAR